MLRPSFVTARINRMPSRRSEITELLLAWNTGDAAAAERLMTILYTELRRLAARYLKRERRDHTLQPTALVHEAYLQLIESPSLNWQNRAHFFGVAARLMRHILVDHARRHQAAKRGGGYKVSLSENLTLVEPTDFDLLALNDALERLAALDEQQSRVVELRYFGGLSIEETAEVLAISPATVKRSWASARAWLHYQLKTGSETS